MMTTRQCSIPIRPGLVLALGLWLLATGPGVAAAFLLAGSVQGPDGRPVADVDLDLQDLITGRTLVTPNDNTDSSGRFSVEGPAGRYRVLFEPPAGLGLAPHVEPRVDLNADIELEIALTAGLSLAGRVTGADGLGVAQVDLDIWDAELGVKLPTPGDTTNALGFYSIVLPRGLFTVFADAPLAARLVSARVDSVRLESEDRILNLRLSPGFVLSGTVQAPNGAGTANIDLDATDLATGLDVPLARDKTDGAGAYAVVLPPGRYKIGIDAPPPTRLVSAIVPDVAIAGDHVLNITLEPGFMVEGYVFDPAGRPIERADLDFTSRATGLVVPTPGDNTNALGAYGVVVPEGDYDLIAYPPVAAGFDPDTTLALAVAADVRLDLRFGPEEPPTAPPTAPILGPPFPNPTPATATLPFALPRGSGPAEIRIFDAAGHLVRVLTGEGGFGGRGSVRWDGRNVRGVRVPSGVYFIRIAAAGHTADGKLVVFRETLSE